MQRDEQKINFLLQKLDCRENEKLCAKKEILNNSYRKKKEEDYMNMVLQIP